MHKLISIIAFVCCTLLVNAQQTLDPTYIAYIEQYKSIAIEQATTYGIPAAITMAQGLLESGAGKSELATEANNHFGIKCTSEWKWETYAHDDDEKAECFRKYYHAEDSFIDHSLFLKNRKRYAPLFELDSTDYKGWAAGLKQCGYATDSMYPHKLINLIERYRLDTIH